jgi:hypothetical protein
MAAAEAGFITFVISSAELVSKCRIPTAAVAQRGLFRTLLGSSVSVENVQSKVTTTDTFNATVDTYDTSYTATPQSYTSSRPDNVNNKRDIDLN